MTRALGSPILATRVSGPGRRHRTPVDGDRPTEPARTARKPNPTLTASVTKIRMVHTHCAAGHDIAARGVASSAAIGG